MHIPMTDSFLASPFTTAMKRSIDSSPSNSSSYIEGLAGVDQAGNYRFINTCIIFFLILGLTCLALRIYNLSNNYFRQIITAGTSVERHAIFARNHTSVWPWIKRHVLYAPLWKTRHNKEIQLSAAVSIGTLPSRFHILILGLYIISNIAYCFALTYNTSKTAATIAELRGRSGALATLNLIPTILFALRNNPFISLLQVSYDTFNLFHRWLARIVIVETLVHVSAWAANATTAGGLQEIHSLLWETKSFQWGAVGAVAFLIIGVQAWSPVRHAFYETFLNIHRILIVLALVGVYVHLDTAKLPQLPYVWLGILFWSVEWIIRTARIVYHNYSRTRKTIVLVEAFNTDACRVTFDLVRPWKTQPGTFVHVYLPRVGLWSSHPFSVAWSKELPTADTDEKLPTNDVNSQNNSTKSTTRTSISLIIRARTGMTRTLHNLASASPNRVLTLTGFVEGPYGSKLSLDSYGTVLLFAGGVGITHQLLYIRHLLSGAIESTVSTRKIILIWSVPNRECLDWVRPWMDEILATPRRAEFLQIHTYITKEKIDDSNSIMTSASGTVHVLPGRCNVKKVMEEQFEERIGAMAVTVCGPGAFADDVRDAVRGKVESGCVDFVEEAFTY